MTCEMARSHLIFSPSPKIFLAIVFFTFAHSAKVQLSLITGGPVLKFFTHNEQQHGKIETCPVSYAIGIA